MITPIEVRRVDRCGATEWAVVHRSSGLICVGCCGTRRQAEQVKARLLVLPIAWESFRHEWVPSEHHWGMGCWNGYWVSKFDDSSMRLIAEEYRGVFAMVDASQEVSGTSEQVSLFELTSGSGLTVETSEAAARYL